MKKLAHSTMRFYSNRRMIKLMNLKAIVFIVIFFLLSTVYASPNNNEETCTVYTEKTLNVGEKSIQLPVNFNESILLKGIADSLKGVTITKIDLVYTLYKSVAEFDQNKLNNNRIKRLKKVWSATRNDLISWNIIGQSEAKDSISARKMFHGFVVYYRPLPTKENTEDEIAYLDSILLGPSSSRWIAGTIAEAVWSSKPATKKHHVFHRSILKTIDAIEIACTKLDSNCYTIFNKELFGSQEYLRKQADSIYSLKNYAGSWYSPIIKESKDKEGYSIFYYIKNMACFETSKPLRDVATEFHIKTKGEIFSELTYSSANQPLKYSVVEKVFKRNPSWVKTLIVMDVTGSMSPYIAKTMAWVKSNQDTSLVSAFVFFNDGDNKPHNQKRTGHVGGIYGVKNIDFNTVYDVIKSTMRKGGGGDCPENNVEAAIKGIKMYPNSKELVMVADNWATPRDLSLIKNLSVPIHIVLCGTSGKINIEYIQLAINSSGSVHTIEQDLEAKNIKPGKTFKLGKSYFTFISGKAVRATHKSGGI